MDKGGRNAHPFLRFSKKNFYSVKISPHLFGITKPNDTLFHRKNEKIFFGCRCFILLTKKSPFTYSHWEGANSNPVSKNILLFVKTSSLIPTERSQMHTLNLKKFYPFTYLELRSRNAPCFYKNFEKYFFRLRALILLAQKVPSLIPTEHSPMHPLNPKIFLKKLLISKTSPHLFPLGEGIWG